MTYTLEIYNNGTLQRVIDATDEQTAIIDFALANPKTNLLLKAGPGSSKTTTLRFLAKYLPVVDTCSLAFNKRIAEEMQKVLPGHYKSSTVNSLGHRAWSATIGKRLTLETKKSYNIVKGLIEALPRRERTEAYDVFGDITKTVSKAKLSGYVPSDVTMGRSLVSADDFFGGLDEAPDDWFISMVNKALREGIKQAYGGLIDFDDQIYMPTLFGGQFQSYPRVSVDEAQDLSRINQVMIEKLVGPNTQLTAVGDEFQSIYAFRGADTKSMSWLQQRFEMHALPLSVSFRCAQKIVKNLHFRNPMLRWPSWAVEGTIETLGEWDAHCIPDNSAIICRNNAPLLSCALALLRSGRGVHLVGTDLGPQLVRALKKLGDPQMAQAEVLNAIDRWEAEKIRKSRSPDAVTDKAECLRVFARFGPTLSAAIAYCEHIFASKGPIQLLSGHKAKGLEWDTVYHLDPHRIPSPYAKEGEALEQEHNVRFVIESRARHSLYFVRLDQFAGGDL